MSDSSSPFETPSHRDSVAWLDPLLNHQPLLWAAIASLGIHVVLGVSLPYWSSSQEHKKPKAVDLVELTPSQVKRLPSLTPPKYSFTAPSRPLLLGPGANVPQQSGSQLVIPVAPGLPPVRSSIPLPSRNEPLRSLPPAMPSDLYSRYGSGIDIPPPPLLNFPPSVYPGVPIPPTSTPGNYRGGAGSYQNLPGSNPWDFLNGKNFKVGTTQGNLPGKQPLTPSPTPIPTVTPTVPSTVPPTPSPSPASGSPTPGPAASPPATPAPTEPKGSLLAKLQQDHQQRQQRLQGKNPNPPGSTSPEEENNLSYGDALTAWFQKFQAVHPDLEIQQYRAFLGTYPRMACLNRLEGKVAVGLVVSPEGKVAALPEVLVTTEARLNQAAKDMVTRIPFEPSKNYKAYPVVLEFKYDNKICSAPPSPSPSPDAASESPGPDTPKTEESVPPSVPPAESPGPDTPRTEESMPPSSAP